MLRVLLQISVLGLLRATIGIYGVVANLASKRTKEIGVRLALGAQSLEIPWIFLKWLTGSAAFIFPGSSIFSLGSG